MALRGGLASRPPPDPLNRPTRRRERKCALRDWCDVYTNPVPYQTARVEREIMMSSIPFTRPRQLHRGTVMRTSSRKGGRHCLMHVAASGQQNPLSLTSHMPFQDLRGTRLEWRVRKAHAARGWDS